MEKARKRKTVHSLCWEDKHGISKLTGRKKGGVKHDHTHLCVALIQMNGPCRVLQGGTVV